MGGGPSVRTETGGAAAAAGATGVGGTGTGATSGNALDASPEEPVPTCTVFSSDVFFPTPRVLFLVDRSASASKGGGSLAAWDLEKELVLAFYESASITDLSLAVRPYPGRPEGDAGSVVGCEGSTDPIAFASSLDGSTQIGEVLDTTTPAGLRATGPALSSAVAALIAESNVTFASSVVLLTSGPPEACEPTTLDGLAALAGTFPVSTYLVAIGENVLPTGTAGFTDATFITDGDVSGALTSLENWFGLAPVCEMTLPPAPAGQTVDWNLVGLHIQPPGAGGEWVSQLEGPDACSTHADEGWYYDDAREPTQILLCPGTCSRNRAGAVNIAFGCRAPVSE